MRAYVLGMALAAGTLVSGTAPVLAQSMKAEEARRFVAGRLFSFNCFEGTKGAGRIAEVGARFALDAMPGKQMAIDADLNAGLIGEAEAKKRRQQVSEEADFYGSMDGASKFVRGDAVAGILILFINIIGGLIIGVAQHNLAVGQAANNYVLLSIGDGLVAQVPGLIISTAAGLMVSRVGKDEDIGQQVSRQLFSMPQALGITAGVLAMIGIIPGMPNVAFLLLAGALGGGAWWLRRQRETAAAAEPAVPETPPAATESNEASWDDLVPVDVLGLEVGYRLIPLVDRGQDGELLKRIKGIRRKFAQEIGFLPPPVHIRDNLELRPNAYRITLKGVTIGEGEAVNGMLLAIDPGTASGTLVGQATREPAFGLPATWIDEGQREPAQLAGYTVVDAATVAATHLNSLLQRHAGRLLGRQEVQALVDHLAKAAPKLLEELVPKVVSLTVLQKVLANLLEEGVHIRDVRTIVEALGEHAPRTQDPAELTAQVRLALGPAIVQSLYGAIEELQVIVVEPDADVAQRVALLRVRLLLRRATPACRRPDVAFAALAASAALEQHRAQPRRRHGAVAEQPRDPRRPEADARLRQRAAVRHAPQPVRELDRLVARELREHAQPRLVADRRRVRRRDAARDRAARAVVQRLQPLLVRRRAVRVPRVDGVQHARQDHAAVQHEQLLLLHDARHARKQPQVALALLDQVAHVRAEAEVRVERHAQQLERRHARHAAHRLVVDDLAVLLLPQLRPARLRAARDPRRLQLRHRDRVRLGPLAHDAQQRVRLLNQRRRVEAANGEVDVVGEDDRHRDAARERRATSVLALGDQVVDDKRPQQRRQHAALRRAALERVIRRHDAALLDLQRAVRQQLRDPASFARHVQLRKLLHHLRRKRAAERVGRVDRDEQRHVLPAVHRLADLLAEFHRVDRSQRRSH